MPRNTIAWGHWKNLSCGKAYGDDKVSALKCWMFDVWLPFSPFFFYDYFLKVSSVEADPCQQNQVPLCLLTPVPLCHRFECCCGDVLTCRSLCCSFLPAICWWRPSVKRAFNCYSNYLGVFVRRKKPLGWNKNSCSYDRCMVEPSRIHSALHVTPESK